MRSRSMLATALALCLGAGALSAQGRPIELGLDGGFSFKVNDPTLFTFTVPVQGFRAGFFLNDRVSFEPVISFNYLKFEGEDAGYTLAADAGVLFHLTADMSRSQVYVRPAAGIGIFGGGGESASQFHVGGGLGVKVPLVSRLALRLEAGLRQAFENDDFDSATTVFGLIGFSFFTR